MAKDEAISKRLKISKAQQYMFLAVAATSVILGTALVLAIYFVKYINFNMKVISAKSEAISAYEDSLKNVDALRTSILEGMADNESLEAVARNGATVCYADSGMTQKYTQEELLEKYNGATSDETRAYYLSLIKMCSALRVVPDALPAQENEEALMSSLNQIFLVSGWVPEALSPSGSTSESIIEGVGAIPVSLSIEADSATTLRVLSNIEKSIREFMINTALIEWGGSGTLTLSAQATAYYEEGKTINETETTVYASEEAKKVANE